MKNNFIYFSLFILVSFTTLNGQNTKFDSIVTKGIYEIYNIEFDKAEQTYTELQNKFPMHPAGKFFDAMIIWWKIMLDMNNKSYDEIFEEKLKAVIDFCDDILDREPKNVDALFFKGGALGFRGRLYSIRQSWFDAALDGKDALPLVYQAYEIDPTNEDVKLGFGIYNYYAEAIPEKYPFIKPAMIFFPSGDKKKGLKQLNNAAEKAKYAAIESRFFLMTLYYQFEEDFDKALEYAKLLSEDFPNNPVFEKYYGRIFVKKGDYKSASNIFSRIYDKSNNKYLGYTPIIKREAVYYLGKNELNKGDLQKAKIYFEECLSLSKTLDKKQIETSGFWVNSLLSLGKIYDRLNDKNSAINAYQSVLSLKDYKDSHKKAEEYLKKIQK